MWRADRFPLALAAFVIALGAFLVFVLPWWVPPVRRVASDSHLFGFNNHVAIVSVGLLALLLGGLGAAGRDGGLVPTRIRQALAHVLSPAERVEPIPRVVLLAVAGANVLLVAVFWLQSESSLFGESPPFLLAADLVLLGRRPYVDFSFPYGPLFLYPPIWLWRLTRIGVDVSYVTLLCGQIAAGHWMLWRVLGVLRAPRGMRTVTYVLAAAAGVNLTMGMNYAPFRFALPIATAFAIQAASRRSAAAAAVVAAAATTVAALVSPEMGLVCGTLAVAWFAAQIRAGRPRLALGAVSVLLAPAIILTAFGREYLLSLVAFGSGGYSFPIFPTAHVVMYLGALFLLAPSLLAEAWKGGAHGPLAAALAVSVLGLTPAALGRCDPGHVYWNGLVLFLLLAPAFGAVSTRASWGWLVAFGLVFSVGIPVSFWNHYGERITGSLRARARLEKAGFSPFRNGPRLWVPTFGADSPFVYAKMPPLDPRLGVLERFRKVAAPVEFSEDISKYLKITGRWVPERVPAPIIGILTEAHLARKLEDLETMDVLLFPTRYRALADVDDDADAAARSRYLSGLLFFPVSLRYRENAFFPERIVVHRILDGWDTVDHVWNYEVMVKKPASAAGGPPGGPPLMPRSPGEGSP